MSDKFSQNETYGRYHGTLKTTDVTVSGTTPTLLPPTVLADRRDFLLVNTSSSTIYVGGPTVTRHNGIPVTSGTVFSVPLGRAGLYAVTSASNVTVSGIRVMEIV
jgi:hypothetical protein